MTANTSTPDAASTRRALDKREPGTPGVAAADTRAPGRPLVEASWIAEHLDDPRVRVVEVDVSPAAYERGHIPGAALWNAYADLRRPDYTPVGSGDLERLFARSGVSPETSVVFYGYGAHLGFWLMKALGHDEVRLMDGARDGWVQAGYRWSLEGPAPTGIYPLSVRDSPHHASREAVEAMSGASGAVILDVRSRAEYEGERFWPSGATEGAGRPGRVPGSVHLPIEKLRTADDHFRGADEMRRVLSECGVTPGSRVVSYCTIGNRASQAWFALSELLGHQDAAVYYGSWAEWGNLPTAHVDTGPPPSAGTR